MEVSIKFRKALSELLNKEGRLDYTPSYPHEYLEVGLYEFIDKVERLQTITDKNLIDFADRLINGLEIDGFLSIPMPIGFGADGSKKRLKLTDDRYLVIGRFIHNYIIENNDEPTIQK